MSPGI